MTTQGKLVYGLAAAVLSGLGLAVGALYAYAIAISAGLCGASGSSGPPFGLVVVVGPYAIVGAWAWRGGWRRVWAWPLAVLAGFALAMLVGYLAPSAHGHCET